MTLRLALQLSYIWYAIMQAFATWIVKPDHGAGIMAPLQGLLVLDFSTLLPGPLASLMLAGAGAEVIKIERLVGGDQMRAYEPKVDANSVNFHLLNRGKRSVAIDLKSPGALARLRPLIERADIVIEQFRPGVMARLGFGADVLQAINPRLIYCSITGWGQAGPKAQIAGHDLNYMAETGLLGLTGGADGAPVLPSILAADIAGGTMPAVINILLALRERDRTGIGATLDIAMTDALLTFAYWGLGDGLHSGRWPGQGDALVTGGSPRYNIYRTADGRHVAAAPIEDHFWGLFCEIVGLASEFRDPDAAPDLAIAAVAGRIRSLSAAEWQTAFAGQDVCCSIVATLEEAVAEPHIRARLNIEHAGSGAPILPLPIDPRFRAAGRSAPAPELGEYKIS
jgi:alpha-methylacyl-CoA racemase